MLLVFFSGIYIFYEKVGQACTSVGATPYHVSKCNSEKKSMVMTSIVTRLKASKLFISCSSCFWKTKYLNPIFEAVWILYGIGVANATQRPDLMDQYNLPYLLKRGLYRTVTAPSRGCRTETRSRKQTMHDIDPPSDLDPPSWSPCMFQVWRVAHQPHISQTEYSTCAYTKVAWQCE